MIAEREALRTGIEHLIVLFPTEVASFDYQVECTDRTVQYKLNHRDVNDAQRAGVFRLQTKQDLLSTTPAPSTDFYMIFFVQKHKDREEKLPQPDLFIDQDLY